MARLGRRLQGGLSVLVYDKTLRLSQPARCRIGQGKITNLMETDLWMVGSSINQIHRFWSLPLIIVIGTVMLYQQVQFAAFSGFGVMLLLFIPNAWIMKKAMALIEVKKLLSDHRIKLLTEYLQGIRIIKLLGWETSMYDNVRDRRQKEVDCAYQQNLYWAGLTLTTSIAPTL